MRKVEDYGKIIFGLAFKFSTHPQETEDLVGDGFVCFMEIIEQEKKYGLTCPFEAALSTRLKQHFLCKTKERKQMKRTGEMIPYTEEENNPKLSIDPWETIDKYISLTDEMREVVDAVLSGPSELMELIRRENFKVGLSKYLRKHKGWTAKELNHFWREVKIKEEE